jgi:Electron transfer DM13
MDITGTIRRHLGRTALLALSALAVAVTGFLWFRPDRLFTDRRVDEAAPGIVSEEGGAAGAEVGTMEGAATQTLAEGEFISLEHETHGRAAVIETDDGRRFLRFEDFETSDGPDLLVYLSSKAPAGSDDWYGYDRDFVDLGELKGNIGNQNYEIPRGVELERYSTAVVWCRRFEVGFAAADLA